MIRPFLLLRGINRNHKEPFSPSFLSLSLPHLRTATTTTAITLQIPTPQPPPTTSDLSPISTPRESYTNIKKLFKVADAQKLATLKTLTKRLSLQPPNNDDDSTLSTHLQNLSISKIGKIKMLLNIDSVVIDERILNLQTSLHLDLNELRKITLGNPSLLKCTNGYVKDQILHLQEGVLNLSMDEVKSLVLAAPMLLSLSYEDNLKIKLENFQELIGADEREIKRIVLLSPHVLEYSIIKNIIPKLRSLKSMLKLDDDELKKFVIRSPNFLNKNITRLPSHIAFLRDSLEMSDDEIKVELLRLPTFTMSSLNSCIIPNYKLWVSIFKSPHLVKLQVQQRGLKMLAVAHSKVIIRVCIVRGKRIDCRKMCSVVRQSEGDFRRWVDGRVEEIQIFKTMKQREKMTMEEEEEVEINAA